MLIRLIRGQKEILMVEKDKIRKEIIEQASGIFRQFGYRKTTMDDIAHAVKKGKSSLYYYYKSKDEIFKAVVSAEGILFRKEIFQAILAAQSPLDKLKAFILARMNTYPKTSNFHEAMKTSGFRDQKFMDRVRKIYEHQEVGLFKNILKEGVEQHFFKIYDIDLAARAIVMAMRGMEEMLFKANTQESYLKQLDDIVHIIFYGIVNKEGC